MRTGELAAAGAQSGATSRTPLWMTKQFAVGRDPLCRAQAAARLRRRRRWHRTIARPALSASAEQRAQLRRNARTDRPPVRRVERGDAEPRAAARPIQPALAVWVDTRSGPPARSVEWISAAARRSSQRMNPPLQASAATGRVRRPPRVVRPRDRRPPSSTGSLVSALDHGAGQVAHVDAGAADGVGAGHEVGDLHRATLRDRITRKASLRNSARAAADATGRSASRASAWRPGRSRSR